MGQFEVSRHMHRTIAPTEYEVTAIPAMKIGMQIKASALSTFTIGGIMHAMKSAVTPTIK